MNAPAKRTDLTIQSPMCSSVADTLARVGDKWSLLVVLLLRDGTQRFGSLKRQVPGISQRMLTLTLRNLERDGFVKRTDFSTSNAPHVEYELTPLGKSLSVPIAALGDWARAHEGDVRIARQSFDSASRRPAALRPASDARRTDQNTRRTDPV